MAREQMRLAFERASRFFGQMAPKVERAYSIAAPRVKEMLINRGIKIAVSQGCAAASGGVCEAVALPYDVYQGLRGVYDLAVIVTDAAEAFEGDANDDASASSSGSSSASPGGDPGDDGSRPKTGKSDRHGDPNAMSKVAKQLEELKKQAEGAASKAERKEIEKKMQRIRETAQRRAKGESHWQKG